ncbi:histidine kinase [Streptomyces sp. SID3212]|uniref:sensor histidine kinase n=1 Tax=Streptomyces sp. SID3212 TaxID=2690259 RepID=UPI001368FDAE|nr:histidine kinase [Streptomyces sp. SID3212]MYV51074.1 sensor histidine kinase [Streptomyces sp. SID3212]MYV53300.1 sensor histidine kinase [Streptomyces sp. SID3212]
MVPVHPRRRDLIPPEPDVLRGSALVRRATDAAGALRRLSREHPAVLYALPALLVLAGGLLDLLDPGPGPGLIADVSVDALGPGASVLVAGSMAGQALALLWRRRAPSATLAAVVFCCLVQWFLSSDFGTALVGLMIALYSAARYDRIRRLPWSGLYVATALTAVTFWIRPFTEQTLSALFFSYCAVTAALAVGLVLRVREGQLVVLAERAAQREVDREQREQLAVFAERSRASREMHDIVGHHLAVIIALADGAAAGAGAGVGSGTGSGAGTGPASDRGSAPGPDVLSIIAGTGRQALSELRRALGARCEDPGARETTAGLAPQPGTADLPGLLERARAAGPRISHRTEGDHHAMSPGVQLAVHRIVQEALTNSLTHAGPDTTVHVALRVTGQDVDLCIRDSGPRAPRPAPAPADHTAGHTSDHPIAPTALTGPTAPAAPTGRGLVGIAERAALCGGRAEAGPTGSGGWLVHASLPLLPPPVPGENPL